MRVSHGAYQLSEGATRGIAKTRSSVTSATAEVAPVRWPRGGREGELSRRVAGVISEFETCLAVYDRQVPFVRTGQYKSHRVTIDRRRTCADARSAVYDDLLLSRLYDTLQLWGIGRRASRLVPLHEFCTGLRSSVDAIAEFESCRLDDPALDVDETAAGLWELILRLRIVDNISLIVPGTKTLHHLLPDLMPPMDRAWTGAYFRWSTAAAQSRQPRTFVRTFGRFAEIARATDPAKYVGPGWRTSTSKVVDNAIIGYCKAHDIQPAGTY